MSTLTRIYTKPIVKVEIGLTFELDEEKVVILEEGLLYKVRYIAPNTYGDSDNALKEIIGRVSKIERVPMSGMGFNPFYSGDIYNIIFDCSVDFFSVQIVVSTAQIRDIDLYEYPVEDDTENGESGSTEPEGSGDTSTTEPEGEGSNSESGTGSEGNEPGSESGSESEGEGSNTGSESGDTSTTEPEGSESGTESEGEGSNTESGDTSTTEPEGSESGSEGGSENGSESGEIEETPEE